MTSTAEALTDVWHVLAASQPCCTLQLVVLWTAAMRYERGTCMVNKWAKCCRHGEFVRDPKSSLYERPVGWGMHNSTGIYSNKRRCYCGCRHVRVRGCQCLASATSLRDEREVAVHAVGENYAVDFWRGLEARDTESCTTNSKKRTAACPTHEVVPEKSMPVLRPV